MNISKKQIVEHLEEMEGGGAFKSVISYSHGYGNPTVTVNMNGVISYDRDKIDRKKWRFVCKVLTGYAPDQVRFTVSGGKITCVHFDFFSTE